MARPGASQTKNAWIDRGLRQVPDAATEDVAKGDDDEDEADDEQPVLGEVGRQGGEQEARPGREHPDDRDHLEHVRARETDAPKPAPRWTLHRALPLRAASLGLARAHLAQVVDDAHLHVTELARVRAGDRSLSRAPGAAASQRVRGPVVERDRLAAHLGRPQDLHPLLDLAEDEGDVDAQVVVRREVAGRHARPRRHVRHDRVQELALGLELRQRGVGQASLDGVDAWVQLMMRRLIHQL